MIEATQAMDGGAEPAGPLGVDLELDPAAVLDAELVGIAEQRPGRGRECDLALVRQRVVAIGLVERQNLAGMRLPALAEQRPPGVPQAGVGALPEDLDRIALRPGQSRE